jgi:hypothetical protein
VNKVNTTTNRSINLLEKMVLHIVPSTVTSKTSHYDQISVILGYHEMMSQKFKISALTIDGSNIYKHLLPIDGNAKLNSQGTHLDIPSCPC